MKRRVVGIGHVLFLGLLLVPVVGRAAEPVAEARQIVQRYFALYAAKDLDGFMALWSSQAPDYKSRKQTMQRIFAETGDIQLKELTVVQVEAKDDAACVGVRLELVGADKRTSKPHPDLGKLNRVLLLRRQEGSWKVWRYVPAEQEMLERLLAAKGEDDRRKLYQENKDLLTRQLVGTINLACLQSAIGRRFDEAVRLNELAFEAADLCPDKSILHYCHIGRGRIAYQRPQFREALASFERALALAREAKDQRAEVVALQWIGNVYAQTGQYADALPHYEGGLRISRALGERSEEAVILNSMGNVYQSTARHAEALERFEAALKIIGELEDREKEAVVLNNIGNVHHARGRLSESLLYYQAAWKIRRARKDREGEAGSLNNIANIYRETERYAEALRYYQDSLQIARELGDRPAESRALTGIGNVFSATGRPIEALRQYEAALKIDRELGLQPGEAILRLNLGDEYKTLRRYPEALRHFEAALKLCREMDDRRKEAVARQGLGGIYASTGRFAEASGQCEAALRLQRELGDHAMEVETLLTIAFIHDHMGRGAEALGQYEAVLKIVRELERRAPEARTLGSIGNVYYSAGRYREALEQYEAALKIVRELGNRLREARLINRIGLVYDRTGRYAEALHQYEKALKFVRDHGDGVEEADTLINIGDVYRVTGRYPEALRQYEAALTIAHELGNRYVESRVYGQMGIVFGDTGRFTEALRYYEDSLKIHRELKDRLNEARALGKIGIIYHSTGRYAEALEQHNAALKIARGVGDRGGEAIDLNNLGTVYHATGLDAEALRHYEDGLAIQRALGNQAGVAAALLNLGGVYADLGQFDKALAMFNDALQLYRASGQRSAQAQALYNIGATHARQERYAEALRHYQASLAISQELKDRQLEALTHTALGTAYRNTRRSPEALQEFREALRLAEEINDPRVALLGHRGIGDVHWGEKRWSQAADSFRQAVRLVEQVRDGARERSLQTSFLANNAAAYHALAWTLVQLGKEADAFAVAEQAKARALLDSLRIRAATATAAPQAQSTDIRTGMTAEQRRQEQQFQQRLTTLTVQLEDLRSRKADLKRQQELARELDRARQDYEAFRRELFLRLPDLQVRRGEFQPASLADIGRDLFATHPNLVVLSYLVEDQETLLFVLRPGERPGAPARLAVHRLEVGAKELAEAVGQFRAACQKPHAGLPDGSELYRLLLGPAEKELAEASHVLIVPEGALHVLSFHALRGEDGPLLVERCTVSYAPSLTALLAMARLGQQRKTRPAGDDLLAVGVGDFGRREFRLPAAEPEARDAAGLFGQRGKALLGPEATRAGLRSVWGSYRYLHLATHGRLNEDAPLYSAVLLSQAGGDEGLLFARDLLDEELTAELVVLSACATGLGRQLSGEGLLGLTWAWFVAGVPSTVASQWSVADDSTARLMEVFYQELKGGAPKAESLRRAQLALLKERKTHHPFYWAPFVLTGDPW